MGLFQVGALGSLLALSFFSGTACTVKELGSTVTRTEELVEFTTREVVVDVTSTPGAEASGVDVETAASSDDGTAAGSTPSGTTTISYTYSNQFEAVSPSSMTYARKGHSATLIDSTVFIAYGLDGSEYLGNAELFDGVNFTSAVTASLFEVIRRDGWFSLVIPSSWAAKATGGAAAAVGASKTNATATGSDIGLVVGASVGAVDVELQTATTVTNPSAETCTPPKFFFDDTTRTCTCPPGTTINSAGTACEASSSTAPEPESSSSPSPTPEEDEGKALHTATLLSGSRVLLAGGLNTTGPLSSISTYDGGSKSFTCDRCGSLSKARFFHTANLLGNGTIVIAGGYDESGPTDSVELITLESDTPRVSDGGSLSSARSSHTATLLNDGTVLIAGGFISNTTALKSLELISSSGSISIGTTLPELNTQRAFHTATLLKDGSVLFVGGLSAQNTALDTVEIYSNGAITQVTATMSAKRYNHQATLLADGRVLITGGKSDSAAISSADIFDPATQTFTNVEMTTARAYHTATLLSDGRVLIVGGEDASGNILNSAEVFK